jgi:sugar phosphate isomerase/epimerase
MTRRNFVQATGAASAAPALFGKTPKIQIGVTDWNLQRAGRLDALDLAKEVGFVGVELSLGRKPVDGNLPLADEAFQREYLAKAKSLGLQVISTCLDILHVNGLKNDKLGQKWLGDAIAINRKLGVKNMLLPFFGERALMNHAEMDYVGDLLRDFGREAEKAGVILGLEDTISAEDNVRIMERSRSKSVKVFYDVGNSYPRGFDIYKEIPWLGKERICQFHLKDNPSYMGEGKIDFRRVLDGIAEIGWEGYADLETSSPSKDVKADMTRNRRYILSLMNA